MGRDRGGKVEGQAVSDASRAWSQPHHRAAGLLPRPPPRAEQPVMALHTLHPHLGHAQQSHGSERVSLELSQPASHST